MREREREKEKDERSRGKERQVKRGERHLSKTMDGKATGGMKKREAGGRRR